MTCDCMNYELFNILYTPCNFQKILKTLKYVDVI